MPQSTISCAADTWTELTTVDATHVSVRLNSGTDLIVNASTGATPTGNDDGLLLKRGSPIINEPLADLFPGLQSPTRLFARPFTRDAQVFISHRYESTVNKFGHNKDIGTTYEPVTSGGVWPTPQFGSGKTLRIKAGGSADDTAAGTGARQVQIEGIEDVTGDYVTETVATAGASASSATTTVFSRILRAFVSQSGTYATSTASSHAGDIVIEASDASGDWGSIVQDGYAHAQSQIGVYTVPAGYEAHLLAYSIEVESTKTVDFLLMQRRNIDDTSAPYDASRVVNEFIGVTDHVEATLDLPIIFPALTDFGFMAQASQAGAKASVDMTIRLVKY